MNEKRHSKRLPIDLILEISSIFNQDNVEVNDIHAPIEVNNVSKGGIGFLTKSVLPLDYYFNAKLTLGDEDSVLYTVVKIVRSEPVGKTVYSYGCEFVGLAPVLYYIFDEYEEKLAKME